MASLDHAKFPNVFSVVLTFLKKKGAESWVNFVMKSTDLTGVDSKNIENCIEKYSSTPSRLASYEEMMQDANLNDDFKASLTANKNALDNWSKKMDGDVNAVDMVKLLTEMAARIQPPATPNRI
jgi:hypothetical protein